MFDQMTGGQLLCLGIVVALVVGAVLITWAKAFAARKTGQWPTDGSDGTDHFGHRRGPR